MWNTSGLDIDLHYANDSHSPLMVSVCDEKKFAAGEEYARTH